ncbi:uncharacterized protein LOC132164097 [Corylus avellana]|uniref:uncharacterized protein LOC132164097 n=1 Tax=Corylus avellana TaxID=13451 RepID=UPI001E234063|nr:uncharacterized protein LOC132164097 [Corylus avellana]
MEEIQHFSHEEHPLIFVEDFQNDGENEIVCFGCNKSVCGPAYQCSHCNFFLHKSCAELPHEIQYPLHLNHTLVLQTPSGKYICDACFKSCERCFFYHCNSCDFEIDIECASIEYASSWRTNTDNDHQHEFVPIFQLIHFTCELCGVDGNSVAQVCRICQFLVHAYCAWMPRRIKIMADRHFLTLIYLLGQVIKEHDDRVFCNLCYKKLNLKYAGYYCQQCGFVAHLNCARKNRIEANDIIDSSIEGEGILFKESEESEELKHWDHEHNLILSRKEVGVHHNKFCEGCIQLIISTTFYSCEQCNYFLHSTCARLPLKKQLPTHPCLLTLYQYGSQIGNTAHCFACHRRSHGFAYACSDCQYNLDVRCCSIPKIIEHEGHQHPLFLAPTSVQECNSCEERWNANGVFVCKEGDFALGFQCATLPLKVDYEHDPHPLSLSYTAEDDYGEYYCLICEEKRNPNHWFYYCIKCNFTAHPRCVVGRYPYIKYGRDFTWENHQHPLKFVRRTKSSHPCDLCGEIFDDDLALNCTQCKFIIHPWAKCTDKLLIK